ncbi:Putative Mg2+ and Co2+ transporter(Mg2+ transporter protein, CorA-like/Zinc transport protein ZntB,28-327) [Magnetospirillum sp. XM-1]|uniref:magnesium transporter CorA family protein n=1 Tax=Magnetospirillum sp. XM-1 TaxID=1663591 RepID=UPI00073E0580|nr:magnesium transporter CorA family protein [Magnetospirillum sp. XM-1]CUW38556.1 Putative Mg2+ and Co2+ transporter(Mg2+ transporter protein, CorA-like/Zinc transport protein ZntB,28-327) [Magnetospirillum sp. XM-1]
MITTYHATPGGVTPGSVITGGTEHVGREALWIDLLAPSPEEIALVEARTGLDLPSKDRMQEIETSSRLSRLGDALAMTVPVLTGASGFEPRNTAVTFILSGTLLVTLRHDTPHAMATYSAALPAAHPVPVNGGDVMLGLMEAIVDRIADVLQDLGAGLDGISHRIFHQPHGPQHRRRRAGSREMEALLRTIGRTGDLSGKARETLLGLKRATAFLPHGEGAMGLSNLPDRLRAIDQDLHSLAEYTDFLGNKINFLLDATLGLIGIQQNQVIKLFTIMSVLFLPPTLVASWYGMNFKIIPELQWELGYLWAIGLAVVSAVLPYIYFRRKGWV